MAFVAKGRVGREQADRVFDVTRILGLHVEDRLAAGDG